MTNNPDKVSITFEDPANGELVTVTLGDILSSGIPINDDGIDMEFVQAEIA